MSFTVRRPVDKEEAKEALGRVFRLIAACGRKVRDGKIRVRYVRRVSVQLETTEHDLLMATEVKDFVERAPSVMLLSRDKVTLRLNGF